MPIISRLTKGVGAAIGAASEVIADHKKKAARERGVSPNPAVQHETGESSRLTAPTLPTGHSSEKKSPSDAEEDDDSSSISSSALANDNAEWALDEAAEELEQPPPSYEEAAAPPASDQDVARAFVDTHQLSALPSVNIKPLPCPVILPQRRPKDQSRGFVRAYAPLLGECAGIDQKTFIDFINDLDRASKASPVFDVINLACFAAGFVPSPIAMATTIAVQVASHTAEEIQTRHRGNTYLDQINESLFKPRGLYCMIMTFKPDSPHEPLLGVDLSSVSAADQALAKATSIPDSALKQKLAKLRLASGVSKGELSLPESAPLIYPAIDAAAVSALNSAEGSSGPAQSDPPLSRRAQDKLRATGGFLASYLDRRAQASYAGMHPDSKLAVPSPEKTFASRFSDPNHPANSGTILGLLTGGHFDPKAKKRGRRAQRRAHKRGYELSPSDVKNAEMGRLPKRRQGVIRKVLQKDILYLTVVNLPSEAEMREIMGELERVKS
ncbi:hypothetical protein A1O7_02162 [Cladophialophora yegresii CBS 114405]|uniref:Uncharacterized protein n=1 Tax=Cladophialophora yegresii CBS 114405 TaxID=1182544 RepID=W9W192_9EURO|nr:uncharacterized protein A1O7_02162 [Cladophialophora yegresii CBS 114405]EXJ61733.1 hypothetical protein A1O7_02162 [Cladophialophora yegresii CBS 114405]